MVALNVSIVCANPNKAIDVKTGHFSRFHGEMTIPVCLFILFSSQKNARIKILGKLTHSGAGCFTFCFDDSFVKYGPSVVIQFNRHISMISKQC